MSRGQVRHCVRCGNKFVHRPGEHGPHCSLRCRFFAKVDPVGPTLIPELGPCHTWTGARLVDGRGEIRVRGETITASRMAWFLEHGEWPVQFVLHRCDGGSTGCVRPSHLYEGTQADNTRDKILRNRIPRGTQLPQARIDEAQVVAIRGAVASGAPIGEVAARFGISRRHVRSVVSRNRWAHVP